MAVYIKPIKAQTISFGIVGISPLIYHAWSARTKAQLLLTPIERRKQPKEKRDPEAEAAGADYRLPNGKPAFPLLSLKAAMIEAAHKDLGLDKVSFRKAFFLPGVSPCLVELFADEPRIREDIVRVGVGSTDVRYRPEYFPWRVTVQGYIDASILTPDDIINLANRAGFGVGVGEWRPQRGGENGRFKIDRSVELTVEEMQL